MIEHTLMVFGPGGVGKSPLDSLVRGDALRIDPYRLRSTGPRDTDDVYYAHPKLRGELSRAFMQLGDDCERVCDVPVVEWFPKCKVTMFDVRGEWQCLLLGSASATHAKAEVFAPAVPPLLTRSDVREYFGELSIVILNPSASLRSQDASYSKLKAKTDENCSRRGDTAKSVAKRTASIDEEAKAWKAMLGLGGTEFSDWEFPEYAYREDRVTMLVSARRRLVAEHPRLEQFFKAEAEIRSGAT